MSLSILGFLMMGVLAILLLRGKGVPLIFLILVPMVFALMMGFTPEEVFKFSSIGVSKMIGVVSLFIFSIMYFGIVSDAGMFDTLVAYLVKTAGTNVVIVAMVTIIISMLAHLDGAGATTFLITIPPMLSLYKKLNMKVTFLAFLVGATAGIMNLVPWGGPMLRAATAINMDATELWIGLIPIQVFGIIILFVLSYFLALKEIKDGAGLVTNPGTTSIQETEVVNDENVHLKRPNLLWFNALLTFILLVGLVIFKLPSNIVFMVGFTIALLVNYPNVQDQGERVKAHASSAILMAMTLLAAGIMLGILSETKLDDAMATTILSIMPSSFAKFIHIIAGIVAVPLGMIFGPDPYYYGILPIITGVAGPLGIPDQSVAYAMLIGENVGFPISPVIPTVYLLLGLTGLGIEEHIKFSFKYLWIISILMLMFGIIVGIIQI